MNISKKQQKEIIAQLLEAEKLLNEKAYTSARRNLKQATEKLKLIETNWEKWRVGGHTASANPLN